MEKKWIYLLLKLFLVFSIIYFSIQNIYYGVFLCIIVILLYNFGSLNEKSNSSLESFTESPVIDFHSYVINLDKNTERLEKIQKEYNETDLKIVPLQRYKAVLGKNVNMDDWLSLETQKELKDVETRKYRQYTYQLTTGAVGCFISHYELAKQLTKDDRTNHYLILEDDAYIDSSNSFEKIQKYCNKAPDDWDIILFGYIHTTNEVLYEDEYFIKPTGFWLTHGYIINKTGAQKFVDEVEQTKIDGQLDAYLSRMQQQKKINIYGTKDKFIIIKYDENWSSNIQIDLIPIEGINSHNFKGYVV
jgi:GR25 family glycosyltransferase involved in LPS biosynthesis